MAKRPKKITIGDRVRATKKFKLDQKSLADRHLKDIDIGKTEKALDSKDSLERSRKATNSEKPRTKAQMKSDRAADQKKIDKRITDSKNKAWKAGTTKAKAHQAAKPKATRKVPKPSTASKVRKAIKTGVKIGGKLLRGAGPIGAGVGAGAATLADNWDVVQEKKKKPVGTMARSTAKAKAKKKNPAKDAMGRAQLSHGKYK